MRATLLRGRCRRSNNDDRGLVRFSQSSISRNFTQEGTIDDLAAGFVAAV